MFARPIDSATSTTDRLVLERGGPGISCRLGRDVTLVMQDERARLLDLNRGRFFALNATGTRLLALTLEVGPVEAASRVARDYGIDQEQVYADCERLLQALRRRRLVETNALTTRRVLPGRRHLWMLFTLAWICLRLLGWARTIRFWRRGRDCTPDPWDVGFTPLVEQLDQAILVSAATHPLSLQCKERAMVAWHILRNRWNLPAELNIGIMAFPFEAHAWVECGPLTVTDERARCETFKRAVQYQ